MHQQEERDAGFGQLTRESLVYATGSAVGKVIGFLMLPILTRFLAPAEYGRLDLLSTLGSALISALLLGIDVVIVRTASDPGTSPVERRTLFGTWALIAALLTVPVALVVVLFAAPLSLLLFGTDEWALGVAQVGLTTVFGTYQVMALTLLRIARRPMAYAAVSAGSLLVNAIVAIVLLVAWRPDSVAVLTALTVSVAVGAAGGMTLVGWNALGRPAWATGRMLLRLGLPLAPAVVAVWAGEFINRSILLGLGGAQELGLLSVALRFGSIVGLAVAGFQLAWQPRAYALGTEPAALSRIGREGRWIVVTLAAGVVAMAAVSPEAISVIAGPDYQSATGVLGWVLASQLGAGVFLVLSMPSSLVRRFWHLGVGGVAGVAVSIALNLALAASAGATGTALALASGQAVAVGVVWLLGRGTVRVPFQLLRTLCVVGASACYAVVATNVGGSMSMAARAVGLLAFVILVILEGTAWEIIGSIAGRQDGGARA